MELPKIIKDKIIVLYGCDSFDDYLKIEFVNSIKQLIIDDLDDKVQSEDQFKKIKDELKYYFQITKSTYGYRISLKNQFDSSRRWKRVKLNLDNKQIFDLEKHIIANEFLINNSNEYLLKLFNQLDKLEPNSQRLLNYISRLNKEVNNGD
ncbi:hypothetical protein JV173_00165 [Acholeplasma equirhinis]|uniref:hypothetical protein n=1 Tax=Acholeplasma equirhinis TaxID=555393 RepID=UPI00197ABD1E|nr:hypothetical protein [Acholeplasma equirhinis]MBN3489916.1 hypothetical protein [Acholeplasma equirhinis]